MKILKKPSIGVFCSAKNNIPNDFLNFAYKFGSFLGKNNFKTVYGGGNQGMMKKLAEGVCSEKGDILGIITLEFIKREGNFENLNDKIICESLDERKKLLISHSDVLCVLPGGFGSLDELFTAIQFNNLNSPRKTLIIVDYLNFYAPLLNWLEDISNINIIEKPANHFCIARSLHDIEKLLL
ncbi:TIGR00730 family Rossman fold protein [Fluviispira multicolorata]|uniref:Cytokinin riboside 5'-monophosphate phosphoribohydrolase n=1 Tax=Fluviispira multicolorata TaxID=2654512 RepID=A0A833JDX4_9BACT|nr:TIGR00730 family Rossman fold protein [Fluviispira multicolorata]KAB8031787.1 TIGR00730 family Rossman fold protein [Fluviispira multicolorata]